MSNHRFGHEMIKSSWLFFDSLYKFIKKRFFNLSIYNIFIILFQPDCYSRWFYIMYVCIILFSKVISNA
jgi:hypothetical protein